MKGPNGRKVAFNRHLSAACLCNTAAYMTGAGAQAKAAVFYICPYMCVPAPQVICSELKMLIDMCSLQLQVQKPSASTQFAVYLRGRKAAR